MTVNNKAVVEIGGKEYVLTFGLDFLRRMNERYKIIQNGFEIAAGLMRSMAELTMRNPVVLYDVIDCATALLHDKPSQEVIENWIIEQTAEEESSQLLFERFFNLLKLAPTGRAIAKNFAGAFSGMEPPQEEGNKLVRGKKKAE